MKSKEQIIEKKQKYIVHRNIRMNENENLTPVQHQALAILSTYRHKIHSHKNDVAEEKSHLAFNCIQFLRGFMPVMLKQAGLPELVFPIEYIINVNTENLEKKNTIIEEYMRDIDTKYGTQYAPKGFARRTALLELQAV